MALSSPVVLLQLPRRELLFSNSPFPSSTQPLFLVQTTTKLVPLLLPIIAKSTSQVRCLTKSTEEDRLSSVPDSGGSEESREHSKLENHQSQSVSPTVSPFIETPSLGIREPVYEVVEVKPNGVVSTRKINRRNLLKSSGLRPRDIRSVDPSLFLTNSVPSLLVREHAILLNLGTLRAIAMQEHVLIFDYNRKGGKAFLDTLLPRLNPRNIQGGPSMPFELEVVEAALLSRVQRLEQRLMDVEPRQVASEEMETS